MAWAPYQWLPPSCEADQHLGAFLAHADSNDRAVPAFVRKELQAFLTCGVLEHGFAALCAIIVARSVWSARLVPLVPPPRTHRVRYQGVLASHHRLRARVVPAHPGAPRQLPLLRDRGNLAPAPKHRIDWQRLMVRTFGFDPLECPDCRRTMRIVEFVTRPTSIAYHLHWRGIPAPTRAAHRPRRPPQLELPLVYPNAA